MLPNGDQRWIENPNYVPPTPPQGPAFSSTLAGMIAQADIDFNTYKQKQAYDIAMGITTPADAQAKLDLWKTNEIAKLQNYWKQAAEVEAYNQELPTRQYELERTAASERRAEEAAWRTGQQQKIGELKDQSQRAQELVNMALGVGVMPAAGIEQMVYDPMKRAQELIAEHFQSQAAAPPRLEPRAAPTMPAPEPFPDLTRYAPAAPGGPTILAPIAPVPGEEDELSAIPTRKAPMAPTR